MDQDVLPTPHVEGRQSGRGRCGFIFQYCKVRYRLRPLQLFQVQRTILFVFNFINYKPYRSWRNNDLIKIQIRLTGFWGFGVLGFWAA